jgi:hypothetical protein
MNGKRLIVLIMIVLITGCETKPTSMPIIVPSMPTSSPTPVPPTATPVPPTATLLPPTPTIEPFPPRNYPDVIVANFEVSPNTWLTKMDWFKEIGVNTIIIHFSYMRDTGEVYEVVHPFREDTPTSEEFIRQLVITAREEGFAVLFGPLIGRLGDPHVPIEQIDDWDRFKSDSIEISVRWAAIAEELHVEYYMPFCELNAVLFAQENPNQPGESRYSFDEVMALIEEWDNEAIPQIRDVFSGKLTNQIYSTFPGSLLQYPVKGYDIVGFAYKPHSLDEIKDQFETFLEDPQTLAQQEGIDWMAVEMDVYLGEHDNGRKTLEIEADLWRVAFEIYLADKVIPPIGFGTSLDTTVEGYMSDEGTPSEEVFREFFAALDEAW